MDSPLRHVLTLIAVVAVLAWGRAGTTTRTADGGSADTATQEETTTEASPADAEAALKDTSTKPVIPKPTGTPPRKLVIEDIVKGKGPGAKPGDTVVVHYVGMNFSNGQEFDASWDAGAPFPVELGAGAVIAGWDQGLVGIREGGRRKLIIPPELGYGARGLSARHPAQRDARVRRRRGLDQLGNVARLTPQLHGFEGLLLGGADAIPDDATALDLGDLPEVLVYAEPTPCAARSYIQMKKDEIVQVAHFPDRRAPVGKDLEQACPPAADRIMPAVGSLQLAQPRVPLHPGWM